MWSNGILDGRISALVLSMSIAAIVLTGTLPYSVAAAGEKPSWSVGDYWEYEGNYYYYSFKQSIEVKGEETLVQNGKSYTAFRIAEEDTYSIGPQAGTVTYVDWYQSSDLSLLRREGNLTMMMPPNTTATVTYDPPLPLFQFPLVVGETWTSASNIVVTKTCQNCTILVPPNCKREITSIFDLSLTLNVNGQAQTRTFRSYVLRDSFSTPSNWLQYYSDEAGFWVKHEGFAENGSRMFEYSLKSYSHTPPPSPPDVIIIVIIIIIVASTVIVIVIRILLRRRTPPNVIEGGGQREPPPP